MRIARGKAEKGASLVEFAIVMPLLVLLLLGIVELGWTLAQHIDVRHKARETLRLAIVDDPIADIEARGCQNDIVRPTDITSILVDTDPDLDTNTDPGEPISVAIDANLQQLTGLFSPFFGPNPVLSSTVVGRIEQIPGFASGDLFPCP